MSDLPANWQRKTLAETCDILAGFGFPERLQGKTTGDIPFFKVGDISTAWKEGSAYLTTAKHYLSVKEAKEIRARPLPKNTTVFAKIGAAIALNRRAMLSDLALVDNNVMGLHPVNEDLDYKFLFHFVCTLKLDQLSRATTVPSVRKSDIEQIEIPIPPPDEQRRIVAEIEKQFTRLDAGMTALRRVNAKLKRYRAAVLKAACEGRLVPIEAELAHQEGRDFQSAKNLLSFILADRLAQWAGRGNLEHLFQLDAPAHALPEGWTWAKVDQLASPEPNSITDGPFGSNLKTEHYTSNGPRVVRLQNIGEGVYIDEDAHISEGHFEQLKKHRIVEGDIVIAAFGANPPRSCIIPERLGPAIVKADCIRLNPHRLLLGDYINYALNSEPVRKRAKGMVHGVGRPRLNLGEIKSIVIPLPPLAEQHRIVAEVDSRLSVIDELEVLIVVNLLRANRLRHSVLHQAFSGKLL